MKRREFLKAMGMGAAVIAMPGPLSAVGRSNRKPNFIIILTDDMGYGDSSVYDGWIKMPHLERMAAGGLTFTDFHSSGAVCSPTRAGLMTGRYQQRAGIPGVINADPKLPVHYTGLQPTEVTFPKLLKRVGYTSGIFGKWHLGYLNKFNPLHHGFDRFRGYVSGNIDYISHYDRMGVHDWWEGLEHVREEGYSTHLITKHSVKFIEDNKHRPFCLYVAHEAVHAPNQAPDDPPQRGPRKGRTKGRTRSVKETYQLMMKAMDDGIGEIMATVERLGLAERTLVLFFSDNGGTKRGSNAPLRGGKGSVWEGGHRVPGIAWWPGKIKAGRVSNDLCISLDLMPTMLELAGVTVPEGHKLDGISLTAHLLEGRSLGTRQLFWNGVAMRDGHWKLLTKERAFEGPGLFNLAEDIGEKNNVADKHPERVGQMTAAIEAWKKDVATGVTKQTGVPTGGGIGDALRKDNIARPKSLSLGLAPTGRKTG